MYSRKNYMSQEISIATTNTHYGNILTTPNGLAPFANRAVDVLLLQELSQLSQAAIDSSLADWGYAMVHHHEEAGLGIAIRQGSQLTDNAVEHQTYELAKISRIGQTALRYQLPIADRFRARALIYTEFTHSAGQVIGVFTAHPIVFARPLARKRQIEVMSEVISDIRSNTPPQQALVGGFDGNHYPSPRNVDKLFAVQNGLSFAPITESTWKIRGSKHEWLARIASALTGRDLDSFDAILDSLLYANLELSKSEVMTVASDHDAIVGHFKLPNIKHTS